MASGMNALSAIVALVSSLFFAGLFASAICSANVWQIEAQIVQFFNVGAEANFWTWLNVATLAAAAQLHLIAAYRGWWNRRASGATWLLTGTALFALSLDDLASIHERLGPLGVAMGGGEGFFSFAWVLPGMVVALGLITLFVVLMRQSQRLVRLLLIFALITFFGGSIGVEMISAKVFTSQGNPYLYAFVAHIEEMLEAAGAVLFLAAAGAELGWRNIPLTTLLRRPRIAASDTASLCFNQRITPWAPDR